MKVFWGEQSHKRSHPVNEKPFLFKRDLRKNVRIQLRSVGGEQRIDLKTIKKMMMEMKQREDRLPPEFG